MYSCNVYVYVYVWCDCVRLRGEANNTFVLERYGRTAVAVQCRMMRRISPNI